MPRVYMRIDNLLPKSLKVCFPGNPPVFYHFRQGQSLEVADKHVGELLSRTHPKHGRMVPVFGDPAEAPTTQASLADQVSTLRDELLKLQDKYTELMGTKPEGVDDIEVPKERRCSACGNSTDNLRAKKCPSCGTAF